MKIILFLALITLATCELYHYQECVRGTTVLLKEPCSSGTYEGNYRMIELSLIDFYLCFLAFLLLLVLIMLIIFWFSLELQDHNETCHA